MSQNSKREPPYQIVVKGFVGESDKTARLKEMGIGIGTELTLVRFHSGGGAFFFRPNERFFLNKSMMAAIVWGKIEP